MPAVRNRLDHRPHSRATLARAPVPGKDGAFMLSGQAPPPGFPTDLIVPPHRGAVIATVAWPDAPASAPAPAVPPAVRPTLSRKAARKAQRRAAAQARAAADAAAHTPAAIIDAARNDRANGQGCSAPSDPPAVPAAQAPHPVAGHAPLPPARALVPRRQGFVDILAFVLRDSGRRLARWSSARRRADAMQDKLAKAEARMRAMEAQLAALQALQERVRRSASPGQA